MSRVSFSPWTNGFSNGTCSPSPAWWSIHLSRTRLDCVRLVTHIPVLGRLLSHLWLDVSQNPTCLSNIHLERPSAAPLEGNRPELFDRKCNALVQLLQDQHLLLICLCLYGVDILSVTLWHLLDPQSVQFNYAPVSVSPTASIHMPTVYCRLGDWTWTRWSSTRSITVIRVFDRKSSSCSTCTKRRSWSWAGI